MSILSKVLIGFICIAAAVFFYLAARTLTTHAAFREAYNRLPPQIAQVEQQIIDLERGNPAQSKLSIEELKAQLHDVLSARGGRVWPGVELIGVEAETGVATVNVTQPATHAIVANSVLYGFEAAPVEEGGRFLGRFKATAVNGQQITLQPTITPSPRELERLRQAKPNWILADAPPTDRHDLFAGLEPDQLKAMLPEQSVEEFLRDGTPAEADDPAKNVQVTVKLSKGFDAIQREQPAVLNELQIPDDAKQQLLKEGQTVTVDSETAQVLLDAKVAEVVERKFVRQLRGYSFLYGELHRQITAINDRIETLAIQLAGLQKDLANAAVQKETYDKLLADGRAELELLGEERTAVTAHRQELDDKLAMLNASLAQTLDENRRLAEEYAELELGALRQVDELTRAAATAE